MERNARMQPCMIVLYLHVYLVKRYKHFRYTIMSHKTNLGGFSMKNSFSREDTLK